MDIDRILISEEEIHQRVAEMGAQITEDYQGRDLLVIGILKGAFVFMADLVRQIKTPLEIDFVSLSSYGASTRSTGVVRMIRDLDREIVGRDVLIVEDIVDTGLTLNYLKENLLVRKPASLKICTFLDKPSRRKAELQPDYCGMVIEDFFVVGYGLDFNQKGREYPYIAIVKEKSIDSDSRL
ncbi:MAG: hypoxanthine phosphoribosyltransferase [Clostridiales bacterium]|nr:hypoxanthine phosphoribosyltransferase [Clostridiales bacterium]